MRANGKAVSALLSDYLNYLVVTVQQSDKFDLWPGAAQKQCVRHETCVILCEESMGFDSPSSLRACEMHDGPETVHTRHFDQSGIGERGHVDSAYKDDDLTAKREGETRRKDCAGKRTGTSVLGWTSRV